MPKRLLPFFSAVLVLLGTKAAHASGCPVRIDPGAEPAKWTAAVDAVASELGQEHGDCASIDVRPDAAGAEITLTTGDGREAHRRIAEPEELEPLVRALLIVVPAEDDHAEAVVASEDAIAPSIQSDRATTKPATRLPVIVGASGGLALTSAENATPYGEVFASLLLRRWELGAFGRWEAEHDLDPEHRTLHSSLAALGGGALVGRREPVSSIALVYGATLAAYSADEESHQRGLFHEHHDRAIFDPRLGTFFGAVFPRSANVRLRGQLGAEASLAAGIPAWGLGAALGIETGGP